MYRSIDYLLILFLTFSLLITIKTKSINLTQSTFTKWWIEKHYSTSIIIEHNSRSSFEFCIPFHTCSTDFNRTIFMILFLIFLLSFCFYYHCYEYSKIKHDINKLQQYRPMDGSV